jgi:hypothetical protein
MACACKSNTGARKQVSQLTKRSVSAPPTHTTTRVSEPSGKKQVIIRRPAR